MKHRRTLIPRFPRFPRFPRIPRLLTVVSGFLLGTFGLSSCSVPGSGSSSGEIIADLALSQSTFLVVDIASGQITGYAALSDLTSNSAYRSTKLVFRLIPTGNVTLGAATDTLGAGVDASASSASVGRFYCAVFEVTQAQWQLIAGTTPWITASVLPPGAAGTLTTDSDKPAYSLSKDSVAAAVQAHNSGKPYRLAIPTNLQWERACRADAATPFSWGSDANSRTAALPYAVVAETAGTALGPSAVAQTQPNAFDLYDTHGNVWEITHTGLTSHLRGGSWFDPLSQARCSNLVSIDRGTAHVLAGVRFVLVP
jgi:formylglycine-generating enzyme required for sulfatase activity